MAAQSVRANPRPMHPTGCIGLTTSTASHVSSPIHNMLLWGVADRVGTADRVYMPMQPKTMTDVRH